MSYDDLDLPTMNRITNEEALGVRSVARGDTPDEAEFRRRVAVDIAKMKSKGIEVQLPNNPVGQNA